MRMRLAAPLLVGLVVVGASGIASRASRYVVVALLFSWLGDILLTPSGDLFFRLGLVAFAVAQSFYIAAFRSPEGRRRPWNLRIAAPYALWWVVLVAVLAPKLGILTVAVAVYGALLLTMAATSWRVGVVAGIGGLLFAVSDSLIALTSLGHLLEFSLSGALIMATYSAGQFLIVWNWTRPQTAIAPAEPELSEGN